MNQLGHPSARMSDLSIAIDSLEREESLDSLVGVILNLIQRCEEIERDLERRTTALAARSMINVFHAINLLTTRL